MARVAGKVAVLLAGAYSSQTIDDQSPLVQHRLEVHQPTTGCPYGYTEVPGDVGGWDQFGMGMDRLKDSADKCADDCDLQALCKSFEWSPTTNICSLNKDASPNLGPYADYMFCQVDENAVTEVVDPGHAGFVFKRLPAQDAPNAFRMQVGECNRNGTCLGYWGTDVNVSITSTGGLAPKPGDSMYTTYEVEIGAHNNASGLWRVLDEKYIIHESCAICTGSCTKDTTNADLDASITYPTEWDSKDFCDETLMADVAANYTGKTMMSTTVSLPAWANESVEGHILLSATLKDSFGTPKSSDAFGVFMSSKMSKSAHRKRPKAKHSLPSALFSILKDGLKHTVTSVLEGAKTAAKSVSLANLRSDRAAVAKTGTPSFVFSLTGMKFNGQPTQNLTLTAPKVCTQIDGGSVACTVPLKTDPFDMSLFMNLEGTFEDGDYLNMTLTPRNRGLFGGLIERILHPAYLTLPLCGTGKTVEIYGNSFDIAQSRCGQYKMMYIRKQPKIMTGADLPFTEFPPVPDLGMDLTIDDLLPSGLDVALEIFKADGASIMSGSGYFGVAA